MTVLFASIRKPLYFGTPITWIRADIFYFPMGVSTISAAPYVPQICMVATENRGRFKSEVGDATTITSHNDLVDLNDKYAYAERHP